MPPRIWANSSEANFDRSNSPAPKSQAPASPAGISIATSRDTITIYRQGTPLLDRTQVITRSRGWTFPRRAVVPAGLMPPVLRLIPPRLLSALFPCPVARYRGRERVAPERNPALGWGHDESVVPGCLRDRAADPAGPDACPSSDRHPLQGRGCLPDPGQPPGPSHRLQRGRGP